MYRILERHKCLISIIIFIRGGTWKLINTDDKEMTERDVRGSYYLMYFGFCNCPDICP